MVSLSWRSRANFSFACFFNCSYEQVDNGIAIARPCGISTPRTSLLFLGELLWILVRLGDSLTAESMVSQALRLCPGDGLCSLDANFKPPVDDTENSGGFGSVEADSEDGHGTSSWGFWWLGNESVFSVRFGDGRMDACGTDLAGCRESGKGGETLRIGRGGGAFFGSVRRARLL